MSPALDQVIVLTDSARIGLVDALEHLGDISQVEGVMRLGGSRFELKSDFLIGLDGSLHHAGFETLYSSAELKFALVSKDVVHDVAENVVERSIRVGSDIQHVVMTSVSVTDRSSSGTWWSHSGAELDLNKIP